MCLAELEGSGAIKTHGDSEQMLFSEMVESKHDLRKTCRQCDDRAKDKETRRFAKLRDSSSSECGGSSRLSTSWTQNMTKTNLT